MRRLMPFAFVALAACSGNQATGPGPVPRPTTHPTTKGPLLGLTRGEVGQRFGLPDFTVQEGPGAKVQYRVRSCVLDLYLYRPEGGQGEARVTHVDVRDPEGRRASQPACVAAVETR